MKPFDWIINKFKRKDYNIGIMRFGDNIVIPGREYFNEDKQIELLEEYKKHYLEELNKRNVVTTLNFNSNELKKDMNMNVDIIVRMLMNNEDFYRFAPEELIIQSLKLKMYYEEINRLEEETILRLVALKKIERSKKVPRRSRMALEEEINQLSVILEMYSYKKAAIAMELKSYKDMLSTRELTVDDDVLKQRLDNLLQISDGIYDKEELDKYSDAKVKIAILERECERYVYINKDKVGKLKEDINRVIQLEIDDSNKNDLMNTCTSLEKELLLFYYYGNHLVVEEDLRKLYEFKFKVLTYDIYSLKKSSIKKSDNGFPYYREIIEKKIEDIIKGENEIFNNKFKEEDRKKIIEYFKDFYLDENRRFDYDDILGNKLRLSLLLSFDIENGLNDFYDKTKVSDAEYNKNIDKFQCHYIYFDDSTSISALFEFSDLQGFYENFLHREYEDLLQLMYVSTDIPKYEDRHIFPVGVRSFRFDYVPDNMKEKFINLFNTSTIVIPSTVKSMFFGDLFLYTNTKKIIFKNGIDFIAIKDCDGLDMVLPPSLRDCMPYDRSSKINNLNLTFYNYEDSKLLHNKERFGKLLKHNTAGINPNEKKFFMVCPLWDKMLLLSKSDSVEYINNSFHCDLSSISDSSVTISSEGLYDYFFAPQDYDPYNKTSVYPEFDDNDYKAKCKVVDMIANYVYEKTNHKLIPGCDKLNPDETVHKKI